MSEIKFEEGQKVKYKAKTAAGIDMKITRVVGFQDQYENKWNKQYCDVAKGYKPRQLDSGKVENRYVIEHYFGWYPSLQSNLNPNLELNINRRYQFAYESELSSIVERGK